MTRGDTPKDELMLKKYGLAVRDLVMYQAETKHPEFYSHINFLLMELTSFRGQYEMALVHLEVCGGTKASLEVLEMLRRLDFKSDQAIEYVKDLRDGEYSDDT